MPKSYRIRTKLGVDQNIRVKIDQDFDFLEVLSELGIIGIILYGSIFLIIIFYLFSIF